jgi:ABC-type transporter Mla subunit MlaD
MTLVVLAAVGFLQCAFFLFVLFQWTRDTKRKTTTVSATAGDASGKNAHKSLVSGGLSKGTTAFSGAHG